MLIDVLSENPDLRVIHKIIDILNNDGLIVVISPIVLNKEIKIKPKTKKGKNFK